jgi:hypothetical protein
VFGFSLPLQVIFIIVYGGKKYSIEKKLLIIGNNVTINTNCHVYDPVLITYFTGTDRCPFLVCSSDEERVPDKKNCEVLKQSILMGIWFLLIRWSGIF